MVGIHTTFLLLLVVLATALIFDESYPDNVIERIGLTGTGLFGSVELYHLATKGVSGPASDYLLASLVVVVVGFLAAPACKRAFG